MLKKTAFALAAAILVANPARSDDYANIHTVGIISVIGNFVAVREWGSLARFDGNLFVFTIPEWGVDTAVETTAAALLASRFSVKHVTYDRNKFFNIDAAPRYHQRLPVLIMALPKDDSIDAYIVIHRTGMQVGADGPSMAGLSVVHNNALFGLATATSVSVAYEVDVVDARTGAVIDSDIGRLGTGYFGKSVPLQRLDDSYWIPSEALLTPELKEKFKAAFMPLIERSLPDTFVNLDLIRPPPAPSQSRPQ